MPLLGDTCQVSPKGGGYEETFSGEALGEREQPNVDYQTCLRLVKRGEGVMGGDGLSAGPPQPASPV